MNLKKMKREKKIEVLVPRAFDVYFDSNKLIFFFTWIECCNRNILWQWFEYYEILDDWNWKWDNRKTKSKQSEAKIKTNE